VQWLQPATSSCDPSLPKLLCTVALRLLRLNAERLETRRIYPSRPSKLKMLRMRETVRVKMNEHMNTCYSLQTKLTSSPRLFQINYARFVFLFFTCHFTITRELSKSTVILGKNRQDPKLCNKLRSHKLRLCFSIQDRSENNQVIT
jgi:hypothetical protein